MKDSVYPGTIIEVSACGHYVAQDAVAPVFSAPVFERKQRSLKDLADVGRRIKKITKENTEEDQVFFKCSVCGKDFLRAEEIVTDAATGKPVCQECYDKT